MIQLNKVQLRRGKKLLLDDADLMLYPGWKMGLIGTNGCGKSSLFALLRDELQVDQGKLSVPKEWQIAHVAQETPTSDESALEYTMGGDVELSQLQQTLASCDDGLEQATLHSRIEEIDGYRATARAGQILHGLGFKPTEVNQAVKNFSGGWRMRLNLARTLMCRADLLLLDEPTNHLDLDAVLWFEQWLKRFDGTLLLISHDRDFLNNVVKHIAHVDKQQLTVYTGNYNDFEQQRAARFAQQQVAFEKQQTEIAHLQQFIRRFKAKASKAKQAQSRVKTLAKLELISAAHADSPFQFSFPKPKDNPSPLLSFEKTNVGYDDTLILKNIDLQLVPQMRLGLLGANGAGKSTLIKLMADRLRPQSGEYKQAQSLKIGYFSQHQLETLDPNASPLTHAQRIKPKDTEQQLKNFLGGFGFMGDMSMSNTAPFSGGEKARLALALLVLQAPNLLLLDEPTNHLDLDMRHALTVALQTYTGAMVLVSHDRHLLRATTDQFLLVANQAVTPFEGDLDDYRQWLLNQSKNEKQKKTVVTAVDKQQQKQDAITQRAERKKLHSRQKKLEKQLAALSDKKAKLAQQLADPLLYDDNHKAQQVVQQDQQITQELEQVEEEWLNVSEALETE